MDILQLCQMACSGNDEAFYKLICEHKAQLYKIAYSYFKNEPDALEAIQETTFRAYKGIRKLKEPKYFKTWLIRILINYCIDETKQNKKVLMPVENVDIISSIDGDIELKLLVGQLDPKYRSIIILKYYEGFTLNDIAEILEKPVGTIKTWLNQALKKLRVVLAEEGKHYA